MIGAQRDVAAFGHAIFFAHFIDHVARREQVQPGAGDDARMAVPEHAAGLYQHVAIAAVDQGRPGRRGRHIAEIAARMHAHRDVMRWLRGVGPGADQGALVAEVARHVDAQGLRCMHQAGAVLAEGGAGQADVAAGRDFGAGQQQFSADVEHEIAGRAQFAERHLQVAAGEQGECAAAGVGLTGMAHARSLVGDDQLDAAGLEAAQRRDIDGDGAGIGAAAAAGIGDPRGEVIGGRNRAIDFGAAGAGDDAQAAALAGILVDHGSADADLGRDQLQADHRAGQAFRPDHDAAASGVEHDIALNFVWRYREVQQADGACGQGDVAGIDEARAIDGDAVRIGDDEAGARSEHGDPAFEQAGRIAGDFVDDQARALARVVEVGPGPADIELPVDVVRNAAHRRRDGDDLMAICADGHGSCGARARDDAGSVR